MVKTKKELKKILFAHSAGAQYGKGKGSYDLVNYLKDQLSGAFEILYPKIHKPNSPSYEKYKKMFSEAFDKIPEPVILIGHSLGASTLLKYLSEEKPKLSITGLFLVATPHWKADMKEFQLKKNFQESLKKIPAIFLYQSKNDTEVPFEHLKYYEKVFKNARVRILNGKEHIFSKGLPELAADIKVLCHQVL
jgi:predicted alpha/beta hydrolase family esterase